MASSNEVLIVRHGETDDNAVGRFQRRLDPPRNDRGLAHAREIARRQRDEAMRATCGSDVRVPGGESVAVPAASIA